MSQDVKEQAMMRPGIKKLTKWAKEPAVRDLKEDLEAAKPSHDAMALKIRKWNNLRNVEGEARPKKIKGRSSVQPKLIRRQLEWRYPALSEPFLSSNKMFSVEPRTFEDAESAKQNEILLNWQFDTKIDKVKFIDDFVRVTADEGTCIVRLGWERQTVKVPVDLPVWTYYELTDPEGMQKLQAAIELKATNPRGYSENVPEDLQAAVDYFEEQGIATQATQTGTQRGTEEKIVVNRPTLQVLDYENVFIDPSCQGDLSKANFVVVSYETSKAEMKKDGRFKNLDAVNWEGSTILAQPDHATRVPDSFNFSDTLRKRVVAYEYWGFYDVEGKGELKPIVATWVGDVMVRMEENPFPDEEVPFVVVPYMPVKRQLMGETDAELLEDNQAILGAVTRGMIDLMGKSANSQQGFAKGFLDVTNRRRFEAGQDYEFNPGNGDPRLSIYQHSYPELPRSALEVYGMQNQEAEALSGVKSFSGGVSSEAYGEVAAGIKGLLDATGKRDMNILRRLASGMIKIGQKIMAMNAVFLTEQEVVRITNQQFVTIKREDLKGNFDLKCDISTPEIDQAKVQDLAFMLQTIGPKADPGIYMMILAEIADLKRMPALAEKIRSFQPQPDPLEQEKKQLEIEKLRAEIEEIRSKAMENQADAKKTASEADLKDLDYLEQESGTKHERELQKQGAQANANMDLEVTKALLNPGKPEERKPDVEAALGFNAFADLAR